MYFWVWGSGCWWWAFEAHLISPRFGFAPVVGFLGPSGYRHRTIKVFVRWDNKILSLYKDLEKLDSLVLLLASSKFG
jgi:hypothetical protein